MGAEHTIKIENVVASVTLNQSIDLLSVVSAFPETVKYDPEHFPGLVFRLRKPKTTTLIFASGRMVCVGARSERLAIGAARKVVRELKRSGILIIKRPQIRVVNIVATASFDGRVDLERAAFALTRTMYEPEQFPGLILRMDSPKVVILLFASGKLVCTGARREEEIGEAVRKLGATLKEENLIHYEGGERD